MPSKAILFIPDISGFTEFVHSTAISHSKHIISELLELLLDANLMDLQLAEIEGDALFLYKESDSVIIDELDEQIKKMYIAFHTHLKRYEFERICHCGACASAYNLTLKFVVHYGEIDFIKIKDISKPYGSNVIQAHRLLKNSIPINEYILYSDNIVQITTETDNVVKESYDFGDIHFTYKALDHFKNELPKVNPVPKDVPKTKLFSYRTKININTLDLYEVLSNFDYRMLWVKGLDALEYEKNKVNRAGIKHQCLIGDNLVINQTTISKDVESNQLVYGESTTEIPFTKRVSIYYILEESKQDETLLQTEVFADLKSLGHIMKPFMRKNLSNNIRTNLEDLTKLINSGFDIATHKI